MGLPITTLYADKQSTTINVARSVLFMGAVPAVTENLIDPREVVLVFADSMGVVDCDDTGDDLIVDFDEGESLVANLAEKLVAAKAEELSKLFQGSLSMTEYALKFDRLEKFAMELVAIDGTRRERPKRGNHFAVTVVYALNGNNDRKQLWKYIGLIAQGTKIPWIVGGDFNSVLSTEERLNYHEGKARVCAKLDRVLANNAWLDTFPTAEVSYLPEGVFDHSPGILSIYPNTHDSHKPFRYFNYWSSLEDFTGIVQKGWSEIVEGHPMYRLVKKLRMLKQGLRRLHQQGKGDLGLQDSEAYKNLLDIQETLREHPRNGELITQEIQARMKFTEIHKQYLLFLRQKAKAKWIALGDDNTKLFHASMKQRRMQNTIYSVGNRNGDWVTEQHEVTRAFLDFYDHILGSKMGSRTRVHNSIIQEGPMAPGPDGFSSGFFKDTWNIIGEDFTTAILSFLHTERILKEINATSITLIPKMACPDSVSDYRPIACCNVVYKVATKMICSRLRNILPSIISDNQSGFVRGRQIVHNIMVCQDLVRGYDRRRAKSSCMFKIDLQKAYDTLDWDFLQEMMLALGFPTKFVSLIMACVCTPRLSFMVNGSLQGFIQPKRGLRQGDPMSPLLFIIGMEYLSHILKKVANLTSFQFHPRCKSIKLTHLCFVDDLLLFCKGDYKSASLLLQGFKLFSNTSGLQPNMGKSAVFGAGLDTCTLTRIELISGFQRSCLPFRYLGLKICSKRLSLADCECLIIILPKSVVQKINQICRAYLWKGNDKFNGSGNVSWTEICHSKKEGGLGFKDTALWNLCAMGKHVWAISNKKDNLWVKMVNSVYIKKCSWWTYEAPADASLYWKRIVQTKDKLKQVFSELEF
ncbi:uncharacterized protein LOC133796026 [Humulus lupulus]|uniref:uncharacterized protein LOC133796026 n=1 Tax=Humulus lupulus TaxID=3486 RepID=UPI002B410D17|nr:uncharacterized protein LOC133796026 [Humulus lupulus]